MLALLLVLAAPSPQEIVAETLTDGRNVEREVVQGDDGAQVNHGSYEVHWPDGEEAIRGRYKDGLRHGKWRFFHPNGRKQATGWYLEGFRDRKWEYWDEEGQLDPDESGEYSLLVVAYDRDRVRSRGESRNGERHGTWEFFRGDGTVLARGDYANQRMDGEWRFYHGDGTLDPNWITGVYEHGERVGGLAVEDASFATPSPAAVADPRFAGLASDEGEERAAAEGALHASVLGDVDAALLLLGRLDLADADQRRFAAALQRRHLAPDWAEARFAWLDEETPEALAANRTAVRRWIALYELAGRSPGFGAFVVPDRLDALEAEGLPATLDGVHPPLTDGSGHGLVARFADHALADRFPFSEARRAAVEDRAGSEQALDRALAWLSDHQSANGSWSSDGFTSRCEEREAQPCDGIGDWINSAGVTGLALLAFMGAGNTPEEGPYADVVTRGVAWLISQQDKQGLVGERLGHAYVYNHAIATMALCEAACFTTGSAVHEAAQRATDYCGRARNPHGAWRYDVPPEGDNDTSITAWMIQALRTAELAHLTVDEAAFEDALEWIEEMTDAKSARCGYDNRGSYSARIESVNDHFDPALGEAMTAAALYARILIGQTPEEAPILSKHADLVLTCPPEWDADGIGVDLYYWYYGTCGLWQLGDASAWKRWAKALERAALGSQRRDGDASGSWDPNGAWGWSGGRVFSTAIMALCLEAPYRYPRVLDGQ